MNNKIQQFINGIEEVSNYTLTGTFQFSEVSKLAFVKNFLEKVFQHTDLGEKLTDTVMFHDFVPNYTVIFTNEIKREVITITIDENNILKSVILEKI